MAGQGVDVVVIVGFYLNTTSATASGVGLLWPAAGSFRTFASAVLRPAARDDVAPAPAAGRFLFARFRPPGAEVAVGVGVGFGWAVAAAAAAAAVGGLLRGADVGGTMVVRGRLRDLALIKDASFELGGITSARCACA